MAALTDKRVLETCREANVNMREDLLHQERKFKLLSEKSRLEIVR